MTRLTNEERYLAKVTIGAPDECWPWTAATDGDGYGIFWSGERYPHNGRNKMVKATRWRWEHLFGPIPPKHLVCHTCDNPPCQNPDHWFLGTNAVNMADMVAKGRSLAPRGEGHYRSKLDEIQVRAIRTRYAAGGISHQALADEHGLGREAVSKILRRERWAWLD